MTCQSAVVAQGLPLEIQDIDHSGSFGFSHTEGLTFRPSLPCGWCRVNPVSSTR